MLTRFALRRVLLYIGLAMGVFGVLGYALSLFVSIIHQRPDRIILFGRGAIIIDWGIRPAYFPPGATGPPSQPTGWRAERPNPLPWRMPRVRRHHRAP